MKIVNEADLRAKLLAEKPQKYEVTADTFVTPAAKEYLADNNIELVVLNSAGTMTTTPLPEMGKFTYVDARTGEGYREKPEEMTHLRGNLLVPKTHPRIAFRGMLDVLEAEIMKVQLTARDRGYFALADDLQEVLEYTRRILAAEVKDSPLEDQTLFGLSQSQIRENSHDVKKAFGINHPIPDSKMGEPAVSLNLLRAHVRQAELSAANAFPLKGSEARPDILQHLNRLSSGVYILFCRVVSGFYGV